MGADARDQEINEFEALSQDTLQVMLLVGKLGEKVTGNAPPAEINSHFAELLDHISSHFAQEERLMERKSYQGRHWHCVVHREFLNELRLAAAHAGDGEAAVDRPLLRRIRSVFTAEGADEDVFRARAKLGLFKEALPEIHPADLALALPDFDSQQRSEIFGDLETPQASGTLEEIAPQMQRELVASLSIERVAELIDFMTPAQAAAVLRNLTPAESWAILQQLGPVRSRKIAALVEKRQGQSLLPMATLRYLRAAPQLSAGELLADYRKLAADAREWRYVYVVAADGVLLGIADLKDLLIAEPDATLAEVMVGNLICLRDSDSVDKAADLLQHYGLDALPVLDAKGVMMGVVVARDLLTATDW
jgi:CBS domain-containing protein